tara:strand:- start:1826 stop:3238 length:1413 start_codon:yes stop_codon:yes gene_type:complete
MWAALGRVALGAVKSGAVKGGALATTKAVGTKTLVSSSVMRGGGAIVRSGGGASGKLVKSTAKTDKIVKVNNKKSSSIDKKKLMMDEKQRKIEADRKKREEEENNLEQSKDAKKKPDAKRSMKKPGGILQKIIDFISTILIGWIVNQIPKLIEFIKKIIKFFQDIGDKIGNFFKSVGELFGKLGGAISGVWEKITSFDLSKVGDTIKEKFNGLKNAFGNILKNIGEGLGLIKKKKNEDPKKIAKDGKLEEGKGQKPEEPTEVKGLKGTLEKVGGEVSKGKENLDVALAEATKEITKVSKDADGDAGKLVKKEISTPAETKVPTKDKSIKGDLSTITFDGKTYPRGMPGLGGHIPGDGKGGSTYDDPVGNERPAPVIDKVTGNPGERTAPKLDRGGSVSSPSPAKISGTTPSAPVSNITPERKGQDIIVVDDAPPPPDTSSTGGSSSTIYVIEESLNSMVDQQILLDLAYT